MQSPWPNCAGIGLPSGPFIIFFSAYTGADIYLLSLSLGHFTLLKRQSRNPIRRPAFPEGREGFFFGAIIILLGKRKTVGPDRSLPVLSKVISSVDKWPNAQERSKRNKTENCCPGKS